MTRLERFIKLRGISPDKLAVVAGISRQHLIRIRKGRAGLRIDIIRRVVQACRYILKEDIKASQLFDLGDEGGLNALPPPKVKPAGER